ncbi:hypothetical protein QNI19_24905 [Cytophagaceae bacterium DM2B3-1]|uniref:WD40-like Beta Propeller Repeat n=2 Tax=Xanthocytophaga TaxID=3078918 RepID=A0ABT7CR24_9BACT|nr:MULTISPECIES: hypothetical protein [Xanthocytophaga]MDJ1466860.1 hypothetical protein [Xanthocytophaga flavus]MDJ1496201.1 hypothetical protein [Xanthocytophaga flavus]MDJ1505661.1 hypothetical protein [Xanthocytophaga agilis]
MRIIFSIFSCLMLLACSSHKAQSDFWDGPNAYLGQSQPSDTPLCFAPHLLTDSGYFVLARVAFSPDGKEFFYGSNNEWYSNQHQRLNYFRFDSIAGKWEGPFLLANQYGTPTFSMDGKTLLVTDNTGIQQMQKNASGWSSPQPWLKRSYVLYNYMPTLSGRAYVGSNGTWGSSNDSNAWKFAVLPADPRDTSIHNLGEPLNSPGFNGDLYIAPDESYMIISAKETKDFESELWISFARADKTWTTPQSLGPAINNGLAHRFGQYVTPDGKFLFYTKGTSEKDCAVYWVRFDHLLTELKAKAGL